MQVVFIINIVLMFCTGGFLLHNFYKINNDKMVAFHILNDIAFIENDTGNLEKKVQLIPIGDESVPMIDLQELNNQLLKKEIELKEKEVLLKAVEQSHKQQIAYLEKVKKEIVELVNFDSQNDNQKMHSIAKIYKNIPVTLAAKIFESLDMDSVMSIAHYIDEITLSNILSHVDKNIVEKIKEISIKVSKKCTCSNDISEIK